jgi:hypothetical protein
MSKGCDYYELSIIRSLMLSVVLLNVMAPFLEEKLASSEILLKWCVHCGDYRSKLVHFKAQKIFSIFKNLA